MAGLQSAGWGCGGGGGGWVRKRRGADLQLGKARRE